MTEVEPIPIDGVQVARSATQKLLRASGISRMVVVDDEAPPEKWLIAADMLDPADREAIEADLELDFSFGMAGWQDRVKDLSSSEVDSLKRAVFAEIASQDLVVDEPQPEDLSSLGSLMAGMSLKFMTPAEWLESGFDGLEEGESTLLLFDKKLGDYGDGVKLARDALSKAPESIRIGVLTGTVTTANEFDEWMAMCDEEGWEIGQVALVSKDHLVNDLIGFPRMLKMSLTARRVIEVRDEVAEVFGDAAASAQKLVSDIEVPVLVHMVFESSHHEGIDETSTLLRLLNAYLQDELDRRIYSSDSIRTAVHEIRELAVVSTGDPDGRLVPRASEISAIERYIQGDLNAALRPLACGDVFLDQHGDYWILCEQPCDVILRASGKRVKNDRIRVVPVKVRNTPPSTPHFELRDFPWIDSPGDGVFVVATESSSIPTDILDLTALTKDGSATFPPDDPEQALPTKGMHRRRELLTKAFNGCLEEFELHDEAQHRTAIAELPRSEHPELRASITKVNGEWTVTYPLTRVGRLRDRPAEAVLSTFGLAVSRSAETHDLARISDT